MAHPALPAAVPPWAWRIAVAGVLAVALGLRLWGVRHGLPYVYNADENAHFVPNAIGLFGHGLDPHYFVNPPAFTYLLHVVFAVGFGGRAGVDHAFATDPTAVLVVARATSALLGTAAVGLVYLAGARLAGRGTGLLAAGVLTVAFLPVFYGHLALNDGAALAPIALALWAAAGILRAGRPVDYLLAGVGLGLACATKYTGLVALLPILGAALGRPGAARGLLVVGGAALVAFVVADPYAVLAPRELHGGLAHQVSATGDAQGKLGLTQTSGHLYYLWTLTWGLGWAPLAAAGAGLVVLARRDRRLLAVLGPAPVLFVLVMGLQGRSYGRWLLPVFPALCLLAALAVAALAGRRRRLAAVLAALVLAQGVVTSVHGDRVLSRPDTRTLARGWLVEHVPMGTRIVVEPIAPDAWAGDVGRALPTSNGARWRKWSSLRSYRDGGRVVDLEDYERTLFPGLLDRYRRAGFCWVVSGSTQRGRAEAQPAQVPGAIAYYRRLEREATLAHRVSPYRAGAGPVAFSFDWSFDPYPAAYRRPGPEVRIFRLHGGRC